MHQRALTAICSGFVIILALGVLAGWYFDIVALRSLIPGAPPTTVMTATMLLLYSLALGVDELIVTKRWEARRFWISLGLVAPMIVLAIWLLGAYFLDADAGPELVSFPAVVQMDQPVPNRSSPHTAISALLLGAGLGLASLPGRRAERGAQILALFAATVPWMALFGYATINLTFYALAGNPQIGMSPLTAIGFLVLAIGLIALPPRGGFVEVLIGSTPGGTVLRWLLPVAVGAPLLLGRWAISGSARGILEPSTVVSLSWGLTSLILSGLIVWIGFVLHDQAKKSALATREREALVKDLERAADQIQTINAELMRQAGALEQSNQELQQYAFITSHDLRAPLRSIDGFVQLLRASYGGRFDAQADEWIDRIVSSVRKMDSLISDVLSYSSVEARESSFMPIRLEEVLDEVEENLDARIRDEQATIVRGPLPSVHGDRIQLIQLLQNLIGNAIKFRGEAPPRVEVTAERQGMSWRITVADNGIGIAPEDQENIFQLFRRAPGSDETAGSGIGLSICQRVVHRHGGTITVESEPGKGSTFIVTLPIDPPRRMA